MVFFFFWWFLFSHYSFLTFNHFLCSYFIASIWYLVLERWIFLLLCLLALAHTFAVFFFLKTLDCELISSTVWSMGTLGLQIWGYLSSNASALHLSGTCGTSKKCHYANLTSRGVWYHTGSSLLNSKAREGRPGVSNFSTTENSLQGMWAFLSFLSVFWGSFLFSLPFHYR